MSDATPDPIRRRRRGAELEEALLEAAWDELVEAGIANLTMESIAARAQTGVAVLYRRWANKDELVMAAIANYNRARPIGVPDTGTLRGDLLALLTAFNETRATFMGAIAAAGFSGLLLESGLTPAQFRARMLDDNRVRGDRIILQRAHDRGEIDLARVAPAVLTMPMDLVRHDLIMNLEPMAPERIVAIVDDLFLPLVRGSRVD